MTSKDLLRLWLRQQRDLGEESLVLGSPDTAGLLVQSLGGSPVAGRGSPVKRESEPADMSDWRAALTATGAAPPPESTRVRPPDNALSQGAVTNDERPTTRERPAPPPEGRGTIPRGAFPAHAGVPALDLAKVPAGITIGGTERELFGGPTAGLASLEQVAATIASCTRCPLHRTAKNPVPGQGHARAELVCVGEAPGATEDEQGLAFVGQAGQLLTNILRAIQLGREDVFIVNVLKHRPPGNRNPMPDEVAACKPYLIRQLELIQPKVIVALGTFAAQTLLDTKLSIGKLRGSVHRYYGTPLVVTYHPAALLRNPGWKRPTWEDVQLARRILDHARSHA